MTPEELTAAIERVRSEIFAASEHQSAIDRDVLAICDAAAREAQTRIERDFLRNELETAERERDEALARAASYAAKADEARATLAGIERVLRAGWVLRASRDFMGTPLPNERVCFQRGPTVLEGDSLTAAVARAIAELEETK